MTTSDQIEILPLVEERIAVTKHAIESGRVRVRTVVEQREELATVQLEQESVEVERVAIGREIDAVPPIREEGDLIIVPVVEEVLVISKRLMLTEEVHLRRVRSHEQISTPVTLRATRAVVERDPPSSHINTEENAS